MHFIALRHLYQRRRNLSEQYVWRLNKIAPPGLVTEAESFYRQVILKAKAWYMRESKSLKGEVSARSIEGYLPVLGTEVGLGSDGPMPFTQNTLAWPDLESLGDTDNG